MSRSAYGVTFSRTLRESLLRLQGINDSITQKALVQLCIQSSDVQIQSSHPASQLEISNLAAPIFNPRDVALPKPRFLRELNLSHTDIRSQRQKYRNKELVFSGVERSLRHWNV